MVVMGGLTQLCCYCHEITERTCDGDGLACSMRGRPYLAAPPAQPMALALRPTDLPRMTEHDDPQSGRSGRRHEQADTDRFVVDEWARELAPAVCR
jgi:hypothetical protein